MVADKVARMLYSRQNCWFMSNNIPDFTELELHVVATALKERYSEDIDLQLADAEMQIDGCFLASAGDQFCHLQDGR